MPDIKIYTNENIPVAIAEGLKRRGIVSLSARDVGNLGLSDEQQLLWAANKKVTILTMDDDFLKICHEWKKKGIEHSGLIFVLPDNFSIGKCIRNVEVLVSLLTSEDMKNHIEFL